MNREEKKDLILKVAKDSFILFGYKATSVERIAKSAGIGKGTVYNFFETKEDIVRALIEIEIKKLEDYADELLKEDSIEQEVFFEYLETSMSYAEKEGLLQKLSMEANLLGTVELHQSLDIMKEKAIQTLKQLVERYLSDHSMEGYDAELSAFLMLELFESLIHKWNRNHVELTKERIAEIFLKLYPLV